jgi:hypothetical protein
MPESNYFRLRGPRGHGKIKDTLKIIKHQHRFIYCQNICIVECASEFGGELLGNVNYCGTKLCIIGVQS